MISLLLQIYDNSTNYTVYNTLFRHSILHFINPMQKLRAYHFAIGRHQLNEYIKAITCLRGSEWF